MTWLQELPRTTLRYDPARYDFRAWAEEAIGCRDLSRLHVLHPAAPDNAEVRRRALAAMSEAQAGLRPMLQAFVAEHVSPGLGGISNFQDPPIFRVHPHGFGTISPLHKDQDFNSDPTNAMLSRVRNVWIPLTPVFGSNSLWLETDEGSGRFQPVELDIGEALVFDATRLTHGSRRNSSGSTRVSFEVRMLSPEVVPLSAWAGLYGKTATRGADGCWQPGPVVEVFPDGSLRVDGMTPPTFDYRSAGSRLAFEDREGRRAEIVFHHITEAPRAFTNFTGVLRVPGREDLYYSAQCGPDQPAVARPVSRGASRA